MVCWKKRRDKVSHVSRFPRPDVNFETSDLEACLFDALVFPLID